MSDSVKQKRLIHCPLFYRGFLFHMQGINRGGYESMVWIRDKDGKEYACAAAALKGNLKTKEELSEEEKESCMDIRLHPENIFLENGWTKLI